MKKWDVPAKKIRLHAQEHQELFQWFHTETGKTTGVCKLLSFLGNASPSCG